MKLRVLLIIAFIPILVSLISGLVQQCYAWWGYYPYWTSDLFEWLR